jgi:hypothetical protein
MQEADPFGGGNRQPATGNRHLCSGDNLLQQVSALRPRIHSWHLGRELIHRSAQSGSLPSIDPRQPARRMNSASEFAKPAQSRFRMSLRLPCRSVFGTTEEKKRVCRYRHGWGRCLPQVPLPEGPPQRPRKLQAIGSAGLRRGAVPPLLRRGAVPPLLRRGTVSTASVGDTRTQDSGDRQLATGHW